MEARPGLPKLRHPSVQDHPGMSVLLLWERARKACHYMCTRKASSPELGVNVWLLWGIAAS